MFTRPLKEISVIIVGASGSGKSALTARLLEKKFPVMQWPTNGVNFTTASLRNSQNVNQTLKMHIADTSGHHSFSDLVVSYLVDVNAVIFVIDPTIFPGKQFQKIINWIEDTCQQASLAIVISKADTLETSDDRLAIEQVVKQFIKRMVELRRVDFSLYITSAKNDDDPGIKLLLQHLLALPGNVLQTAAAVKPVPYFPLTSSIFAPSFFSQPLILPPMPQILEKKPKLG